MTETPPRIHAGTSGYSYPEWKGGFYPADLAAGDMLSFYAGRLPAVEINNTFYRMPKRSLLQGWMQQVPASFRFVIKASRRITHHKRLKEPNEELFFLFRSLGVLEDRLGAVLYQTPPYFKKDHDRLERFLDLLPEGSRGAFDFYNRSWIEEDTVRLLESRGHALCVTDKGAGSGGKSGAKADTNAGTENETEESAAPGAPDTMSLVHGSWGYLRLRRADYPDQELRRWKEFILAKGWQDAFVFFKHEEDCAGPLLAERFLSL